MVSYESEVYEVPANRVQFLEDRTFLNSDGERVSEQEIFDTLFTMIDEADSYILIDLFLFNDFTGIETTSYRALSQELTDKLVEKKKDNPEVVIQFITDPINTFYGSIDSVHVKALRDAGVIVTITDLTKLRDSNPLYSPFWRTFIQWFGNSSKTAYIPNPLHGSGDKISLRSFLGSLNFKANHRKVVVTDYVHEGGTGYKTLILSANPHDGSSAHSNIAVVTDWFIWEDIIKTERSVVEFSGGEFIEPTTEFTYVDGVYDTVSLKVLTESKIKDAMLALIDSLEEGDALDMAMFYIGERDVMKALKEADERGVTLRLLFDPNKDAFGREKDGVPNRPVAHELASHTKGNTTIRWCDTHGEQCHAKLLLAKRGDETVLIQGSGNISKRNIGDFNLETNIEITGDGSEQVFIDAYDFFNDQWNNEDERSYSVSYDIYKDESLFKTLKYRWGEFSGFSRW